MKNLLIAMTFITVSLKAQDTPQSAFLLKWENSGNYLLELAESVPEEAYNYKPTEREMSIREQLLHIRSNMLWLGTTYFGDKPFDKNSVNSEIHTKQELINDLKNSFDLVLNLVKETEEKELNTTVDFFAGPKTKLQILNLLQDHVTHHRGQLIVYLNLLEIKPPKYIGW